MSASAAETVERPGQARSDATLILATAVSSERASLERASALLAEARSHTPGWRKTLRYVPLASVEADASESGDRLLVTSLAHEADLVDEPWATTQARLQDRYRRLAGRPRQIVYVCTVFRHVARDVEPAYAQALRRRIRRLNLLAAELSRETGCLVADVDRVMAHVGGLQLGADYRLEGAPATEFLARFFASAIAENGLDSFLPFEVHQQVVNWLAQRPALASAGAAAAVGGLILDAGPRGRRAGGTRVDRAAWYLRQALAGRMSAREISERLARSIVRRGLGGSVRLIFGSVALALRRPARKRG
ncbi:MAG TPA: hypothetical protein VG248_16025 [Caulobacteraceae bacterium]|nr:hypothetical protein [Caulobacteraceae bacterium]